MRRVEPSDLYAGPSVSEAQLRARVVQLAHAAGWRVFSLPIAKTRRPVKDAVGYPDLTLARHGDVLWLELKTDKGAVSQSQEDWMIALGNAYIVRPEDIHPGGKLGRLLANGSLEMPENHRQNQPKQESHPYMGKLGKHSMTGEDMPF